MDEDNAIQNYMIQILTMINIMIFVKMVISLLACNRSNTGNRVIFGP